MSLTLPIVIGKRYVRRDGTLCTATACTNPAVAFSRVDEDRTSNDSVYVATGKFHTRQPIEHPADLVADHIDSGAHPHAALMALYAQDAAETAEPWLRWEWSFANPVEWMAFINGHPAWEEGLFYRRKPKTTRIGEFDVPEPLREAPRMRTEYFAPHVTARFIGTCVWTDGEWDHLVLNRGLVHLTREAAELHARALLSFTEQTR